MKSVYSILLLAVAALFTGCASKPRLAILGDSYSTFQGWIPEGYCSYYPVDSDKNDVRHVEECWWYIVAQQLNATIDRVESTSGSSICNTGYNGADVHTWSFLARDKRLVDPTMILVCGATNDCWAGSPIGEFKWSDWTDADLFTFRPAMAKMLTDLQENYPKAQIYFILNSELKPVIDNSVHEICAHYNVPCIDLVNIDKQNGHPSIAGMKAFAEQVINGIKAN